MSSGKETSHPLYAPVSVPYDLTVDHRSRLALAQHEAAERRRLELAEQVDESKIPAERIRIWERLHMLRLPVEPSHPLLTVIAKGTALTLQQLHVEQKQRLDAAKPVAAAAG